MAVGIFSAQNAGTFTGRVQNAVHEVSVLKKAKEAQELEGQGVLQLLESAAQVAPQPDVNGITNVAGAGRTGATASDGVSGSIIDVKV